MENRHLLALVRHVRSWHLACLICYVVLCAILALPAWGSTTWQNHEIFLDAKELMRPQVVSKHRGVGQTRDFLHLNSALRAEILVPNIAIGSGFYIGDFFTEVYTSQPGSYLDVSIEDAFTQELLFHTQMRRAQTITLPYMTNANIQLRLDMVGEDLELRGVGFHRKPRVYFGEVVVRPREMFISHDLMELLFELRFPSRVDVLVYSPEGNVVTELLQRRSLGVGKYRLIWDPSQHPTPLPSGYYAVYLRTGRAQAPSAEVTQVIHLAQ